YHYKAQTENPTTHHGAEHGTSANNVGISTSIGGGILWGTAQSMRHQRIKHASSVTSALHYPNSVIRAFPHYSEYHARGNPEKFHWGMDQQERRSEIAGHSIQKSRLFSGKTIPYDQWVNELWIERTRATTFVWEGLRPYYPATWEKGVRTYLKAADGDEFRYIERNWGSALVELEKDGSERMIYGRLHGTIYATVGKTGAVPGWPLYNENGPAGLNPTRYYCYDPKAKRPETYFRTNNNFSIGLYEGFVNKGFVGETVAMLDLKAIPEIGNVTAGDNVVLMSKTEPLAIWVNGKPHKVEQRITSRKWIKDENGKGKLIKTHAEGEYQINFRLPAKICVLLKEPAKMEEAEKTIFARFVSGSGEERRPVFADSFITAERPEGRQLKRLRTDLPSPIAIKNIGLAGVSHARYDLTVPVTLPEGATKGEMVVTAHVVGNRGGFWNVNVNGKERRDGITSLGKNKVQLIKRIPLTKEDPHAALQFEAERAPLLSLSWEEATPEAPAEDKKKKGKK
ncbi:MAG: hypothetical protein ACYTGH_12640, partial [Planctomycetota bacterium]